MKELDKECVELNKELVDLQNAYLEERASKRQKFSSPSPDETSSNKFGTIDLSTGRVALLRELLQQKFREKIAIAVNIGSILDRFGQKLDQDLIVFESVLKSTGEFEVPKGADPGSEVKILIHFVVYFIFVGVSLSNCPDFLWVFLLYSACKGGVYLGRNTRRSTEAQHQCAEHRQRQSCCKSFQFCCCKKYKL
jgi:hypothetical protein